MKDIDKRGNLVYSLLIVISHIFLVMTKGAEVLSRLINESTSTSPTGKVTDEAISKTEDVQE